MRKKIGVFDSGLGGFLVLKHLVKEFSNYDFIYIADYKYNPYGIKDFKVIENRVIELGKHLINEGVEAIVIACNTASLHASALREITDIPIIEMISITSEYAYNLSTSKRIGVFATNKTIENKSYQAYLKNKGAYAKGFMASEWVGLIEEGIYLENKGKEEILKKVSLSDKDNLDTLIMGCTHFELAKDIILEKYPNYKIATSEVPTIIELKKVLKENNENGVGKVYAYTTGIVSEELIKKLSLINITYDSLEELNI